MPKKTNSVPSSIRFNKPDTYDRLVGLSDKTGIACVRLIDIAVVLMLDRVEASNGVAIPTVPGKDVRDSEAKAKAQTRAVLAAARADNAANRAVSSFAPKVAFPFLHKRGHGIGGKAPHGHAKGRFDWGHCINERRCAMH